MLMGRYNFRDPSHKVSHHPDVSTHRRNLRSIAYGVSSHATSLKKLLTAALTNQDHKNKLNLHFNKIYHI
jgi:hypothetical protein